MCTDGALCISTVKRHQKSFMSSSSFLLVNMKSFALDDLAKTSQSSAGATVMWSHIFRSISLNEMHFEVNKGRLLDG